MKLWEKGTATHKMVEQFTTGNDRILDLFLAPYDVLGNIAHAIMLQRIGILSSRDLSAIKKELRTIYALIEKGKFTIDKNIEDVHSQIEFMLTQKLGTTGKKIHTGRSRNDQVLLDIKLFLRDNIKNTVFVVNDLFVQLTGLSEKYKKVLMPGYTHMQVAMPSSFGLWFGAFAESLTDDVLLMQAAYKLSNQNPLGSAAGYGSSFPIDRTLTTQLLGFEDLAYNSMYAQMGRGKTEKAIATGLAAVAATLSKMAMDVCLFMGQNFGFISFPDHLTTGSSIMPHKKNPDVFELIRARCNKLQMLPVDINAVIGNLPSGYHRDLQLIKEMIIPAFTELHDCLQMTMLMLKHIVVNEKILDAEIYKYMFSVEEVNKLVLEGKAFRDAYTIVAGKIADGSFKTPKKIKHSHEGSIGNLCTGAIKNKMRKVLASYNFAVVDKALNILLK